jgi:hypothetical protein
MVMKVKPVPANKSGHVRLEKDAIDGTATERHVIPE